MYNWKDNRNYRKFVDPDGSVKCVINVDGIECEVAIDVYRAYSKADRKERYFYESDAKMEISMEFLLEKNVPLMVILKDTLESAEDNYFTEKQSQKIYKELSNLTEEEQLIVLRHYFNQESLRSIASDMNIPNTTLRRRRDKILKKLKNNLK